MQNSSLSIHLLPSVITALYVTEAYRDWDSDDRPDDAIQREYNRQSDAFRALFGLGSKDNTNWRKKGSNQPGSESKNINTSALRQMLLMRKMGKKSDLNANNWDDDIMMI